MKPIRENQTGSGRMLKMAGNSICPKTGSVVIGKKGKYEIKNYLGGGGNGKVYEVDVIEERGLPQQSNGFAIKVFDIIPRNEDDPEYKKRRTRFLKEIKKVLSFQDKVRFIIPIYDASVLYDENQDYPWYLMPKAMRFNPQRCYPSKIIEHMIHIGESLKQLHSLGYAHRDIKPNNLLYYQGHMYLADFGLVWNAKDTEDHITEVNDHLGPIVIRPPELQLIEDIESVDYRKSDVYLFAKTLWMLLEHDSIGFLSEYSRSDENVYIYKNTEKHKLETAEPLHRLMEGATKHNWGERITIDDCLFYLEEQLSIITETIPQNKLQEYKYIEQVKHIDATFHPDRKEFSDPSAILRTLNEMSGLACLEFNKAGTTTGRILFSKASYIQGGVFEMEIRYPYYYGKKKTIELAIDCIFLDKDLNFEIRLKTYSFEDELFPQYTQIITALESQAKRVRLNAEYSIRMVQL